MKMEMVSQRAFVVAVDISISTILVAIHITISKAFVAMTEILSSQ